MYQGRETESTEISERNQLKVYASRINPRGRDDDFDREIEEDETVIEAYLAGSGRGDGRTVIVYKQPSGQSSYSIAENNTEEGIFSQKGLRELMDCIWDDEEGECGVGSPPDRDVIEEAYEMGERAYERFEDNDMTREEQLEELNEIFDWAERQKEP